MKEEKVLFMTRKDTILVAVVINAALLAILFATAIIYDTDKELLHPDINTTIMSAKELPIQEVSHSLIASSTLSMDEVDNVLSYYEPSSNQLTISGGNEVESRHYSDSEDQKLERGISHEVEVTVKKGDMLEKIARANGTTINAIKKANNLKTERLQIGQLLKIPVQQAETSRISTIASIPTTPVQPIKKQESVEILYYTIKSGDSPWKVARQNNVNFEDILRLNGLDEEKARNLKVGDRIRIK